MVLEILSNPFSRSLSSNCNYQCFESPTKAESSPGMWGEQRHSLFKMKSHIVLFRLYQQNSFLSSWRILWSTFNQIHGTSSRLQCLWFFVNYIFNILGLPSQYEWCHSNPSQTANRSGCQRKVSLVLVWVVPLNVLDYYHIIFLCWYYEHKVICIEWLHTHAPALHK